MDDASHLSHVRHPRRSEWYGPVPSLHIRWTTLGVGRHVDLWMTATGCAHETHRSTQPLACSRPILRPDDGGPRPGGTRASVLRGAGSYRQRIDMIRPTTIAPKPMAKFHADSDTMNGISSPAM